MRISSANVRDAIIRALADEYSRKLILGTLSRARSVEELSQTENIPISTAYRRVNELKEIGLLTVEKTILTDEGKKFYREKDVVGLGPNKEALGDICFGQQTLDKVSKTEGPIKIGDTTGATIYYT